MPETLSNKYTMEGPTVNLRWFIPFPDYDRILQQKFEIRHFENGILVNVTEDWREIPTER